MQLVEKSPHNCPKIGFRAVSELKCVNFGKEAKSKIVANPGEDTECLLAKHWQMALLEGTLSLVTFTTSHSVIHQIYTTRTKISKIRTDDRKFKQTVPRGHKGVILAPGLDRGLVPKINKNAI